MRGVLVSASTSGSRVWPNRMRAEVLRGGADRRVILPVGTAGEGSDQPRPDTSVGEGVGWVLR